MMRNFVVLRGVIPPEYKFTKGPQVPTVLFPCETQTSYDEALHTMWPIEGDLITLEHDIVATSENLLELINCSYPLCAYAYKVYPISTGMDQAVYAHRHSIIPYEPIKEKDQWANYVALGFTKIGKLARRETGDNWEPGTWIDLDQRLAIHIALHNLRWHIHWPEVEHLHQ